MAEANLNDGVALSEPAKPAAPAKGDPAARAALESKVSSLLATMNGDEPESDEAEPVEKEGKEEETVEGEETETTEEGTEEQETEVETETEEVETEAATATPAKDAKAPTLPAAYRRSLKAIGWEDEEIDSNLSAMGGKFIETAAKFHKSRVEETARWANMGREARKQSAANPPAKDDFAAIPKLDGAALKAHYGEDALVDAILNPVNAAIDRINKMVPTIQATQQKSQQAEMETLATQIEGFFGSKEIQPYEELYGKAGTTNFKEEHLGARNKVLELADALIAGAKQQGRPLGLGDALLIAHDSLSGDHKVKAARTEIKKTLKTREKGISLKPGSKVSKPATSGGPPSTRSDLEKSVGKRLAAVFSGK